MTDRARSLLALGKKIHEAQLRLHETHPRWNHYATRVLLHRPGWSKMPVPDRVQLLKHLLAAEALGVYGEEGQPNIVQSFFVLRASSDDERNEASCAWALDGRAKKALNELVISVKKTTQQNDDVKFLLGAGTLTVIGSPSGPANAAPPFERRAPARSPAAPDKLPSIVTAFWSPHLDPDNSVIVVYGAPLFMRTDDRSKFQRVIDQNLRKEAEALKENKSANLKGCWPFMTLGDAICAVSLTRFLTKEGVDTRFVGAKKHTKVKGLIERLPPDVAHSADAVVIGGARSNGVLDAYQNSAFSDPASGARQMFPYRLQETRVVKVDAHGKQGEGDREDEIGADHSDVWALISRRPGTLTAGNVTTIASNYSGAVAYFGDALTTPKLLSTLLKTHDVTKAWAARAVVPAYFQLLVKVQLDAEDVVSKCKIIDVWPPEPLQPHQPK